MLDFFTTTGADHVPVWVSGEFEDGDFIVATVFLRNSDCKENLAGVLSVAQLDAFKADALKAADDAYFQWQEDAAADLHAERECYA